MNWQDEPRTTVEAVRDETTGKTFLRGTETVDEDRANVFGVWRGEEPDPYEWSDYDGRYYEAKHDSQIGVEVEVRYAFSAHEDIDDHAEVYLWQV